MAWKEIVGVRFSPAEFDDYVAQLNFSAWRPQFVVVHHTGVPSLATKPLGYTLVEMQNLVHEYRDIRGWSAGPHCFIDQNGLWVFTPLTTSGTHSPSWNEVSWGVETLGDYGTELFTDPIHAHLVACLATLHAVVPLDVGNLHFHKEDPLTTHKVCPGVNLNKVALIHDVRGLMASRHTLANPASGRYTGDSPADLAPQSHFFVDHTAVDLQTIEMTYGPVSSSTPADKEKKFRVTSLFKVHPDLGANDAVKAYAVASGMVMLQRVVDAANPANYLPDVVNVVVKPYEQPMLGFTPVNYFIYRNLRLDSFLKGGSPADEKEVRAKADASTFIQSLWGIHTAWNGSVPFESVKLGYDPSNQPLTAKIDRFFYRQNPDEQLPFVARGDHIGDFFHANASTDVFGIEIVLEGDLRPDYDYLRKYKEVIIDVSGLAGTAQLEFTARLEREKILSYIDPAAFFSMHMETGGWLQVKDGAGKKKLMGIDVYDQVITKFSTRNTLYVDIRNENDRSLNFYKAYDDGSGNALSVGATASSLTAQPYDSDKWPLLIRKLTAESNPKEYNELFLILLRSYNHQPILYLEHGQPTGGTSKGRFIAGTQLIGLGAPTTEAIGFRFPNKDVGGGNRIGVSWLLKMDYTMRQDAANSPFPASVVPTATYLDNLFGPIDFDPPWAVSDPVIAWATGPDKKYVDGKSIAALGFEHIADRGVAFSQWTGTGSTVGSVLFYAAAKDTFVNDESSFVPQSGLASGVSNRDSFFEEGMLFDSYSVEFKAILDGSDQVTILKLKKAQPRPRPPEAMLLLGLTSSEVTGLKSLTGFDSRYPRNLLLREVTGNPFTDPNGIIYNKYKVGLNGMNDEGTPREAFPAVDAIAYTSDQKFFFTKAFTDAQPKPKTQGRNFEEKQGLEVRFGDTYDISAAVGNTVTVTTPVPVPETEPLVDFAREIVPGDLVTVKSEAYNVVNVSPIAGGAVITLDTTPIGLRPGTDKVRAPNKTIEDYCIAKDRLGVLDNINRMEVLVADFGASLSVVPNDTNAPAAIELLVRDYGPKILKRARLVCKNDGFSYADDRILYWARIKMMSTLKNHPCLVDRVPIDDKGAKRPELDPLVEIFEKTSRGYDAVSFSAAGARKKVLITGFDPFQIPENKVRSNPSGAAVLALHGDLSQGGVDMLVQTAIFPVRYADFDANNGSGVVENFFERFINKGHPGYIAADRPFIIATLSQGGVFEFWVDRFAGRNRGGAGDNMDISGLSFPDLDKVPGDQFYETTLPDQQIVRAGNKEGDFKVFYNNIFHYTWNDERDHGQYLPRLQPDTLLKIENNDHPEHDQLRGKVPTALDETTTPTKTAITSVVGSGSNYLSNEIFYRVSRLRTLYKITDPDDPTPPILTGHYHLPAIQHHEGESPEGSRANPEVATTEHFHPDLVKKLIQEIKNSLGRALS
jgi:hypothetical protein